MCLNVTKEHDMSRRTEIATAAYNLPHNITRRDAFKLIDALISEDVEFDDDMLVKLYRHFLPGLPKVTKSVFEWVAQAVSKEETRYYLNFVYVENGKMAATDGHRLHVAPAGDLEPGFYDRAGNRVELDATFPDINRVIPVHHSKSGVHDIHTWERKGAKVSNYVDSDGKARSSYQMPNGAWVQKRYLDQIIQGERSFTFQSTRDTQKTFGDPIRADLSDDRIVILMPIRGPKED